MSTKKTPKQKPAEKKPPEPHSPSDGGAPGAEEAHKAFNALLPRMRAITSDAVALINVDLQQAAITGLSVASFLARPEPKARFALLPKEIFDPAHAADLRSLSLACAHAQVCLQSAREQSTEAKLPVDLVERAMALKGRMLKLLKYHFAEDARITKEIEGIIRGSGYKDLASDLTRLAAIYHDNKADIEHDKRNYHPGDAALARGLAAEILHELGTQQSAEEKKWVDLAARGWTLLRGSYLEVQAAGVFLYRREGAEEKFPSLHASSNVGRPRKVKDRKPAGSPAAAPPGNPAGG